MKKKLIALLIGCMLFIPTASFAQETDISEMTLEELQEAYKELESKYISLLASENADGQSISEGEFVYSSDGHTFKYLKNEVHESDGEKYVYVFFEYTNNSSETASPYFTLNIQAFQNGLEIQSLMAIDDEIKEANTAFKDVKNGTTTNIAVKFQLEDESPVSLELSPYVSFGDAEVGEYTFELNK